MTLSSLGALAGVVIAICGFFTGAVAFLVKYALLPYIEKNVVKPMRATHQQVTQNSHLSETPTIPDRLDDIMRAIDSRFDDVEGEVASIIGIVVRMRNEVDHIKRKVMQ